MPATPPVPTPDQVPVPPHADQPSPASPPIDLSTTPAIASQNPAPNPPLSTKYSWFNQFSWSSNKETSIAEVKVNMDSAPDAPDAIQICTESPENRPNPDSIETIKPAEITYAVVDSSPRTGLQSLPGNTTSRSPHSASIPHSTFNKVDASSVLEEQSVYRLPSSPFPHNSPVPRTQEGTSPPVVPNSVTSVFVLNFPMLARSRPTPEAAVTPPPLELSAEPSCGPSIAKPGTDVLVIL